MNMESYPVVFHHSFSVIFFLSFSVIGVPTLRFLAFRRERRVQATGHADFAGLPGVAVEVGGAVGTGRQRPALAPIAVLRTATRVSALPVRAGLTRRRPPRIGISIIFF